MRDYLTNTITRPFFNDQLYAERLFHQIRFIPVMEELKMVEFSRSIWSIYKDKILSSQGNTYIFCEIDELEFECMGEWQTGTRLVYYSKEYAGGHIIYSNIDISSDGKPYSLCESWERLYRPTNDNYEYVNWLKHRNFYWEVMGELQYEAEIIDFNDPELDPEMREHQKIHAEKMYGVFMYIDYEYGRFQLRKVRGTELSVVPDFPSRRRLISRGEPLREPHHTHTLGGNDDSFIESIPYY